jgi:hypothetical protein
VYGRVTDDRLTAASAVFSIDFSPAAPDLSRVPPVHQRLYPHEGHGSVMAMLLAEGIRALWHSGLSYSEAFKRRS